MDIIAVIYGLAVGIIAVVGLYKAYKNDNKITKEEVQALVDQIKEFLNEKSE